MPMHLLQPTLNGGEAAPGLWHRVDYQKFSTWVRKAVNFFVKPQGGVSNRAGTYMMAAAKKTSATRLIPFVFSEEEAYVLEVGEGYIRFHTSNGPLLDENNQIYEVTTDFTADEIRKLYYCQVADIVYFAVPNRAPKQLARYGHTNWVFGDYKYEYGPFKLQNAATDKKISPNWNSTDNKFYLTCEQDVFSQGDVGAWWKISHRLLGSHLQTDYATQGQSISKNFLMTGELLLQTTGTWAGHVKIQYSADPADDNAWITLKTISSTMYHDDASDSDINTFNANDTISLPAGLWWVRVVPEITNGRCYLTLDCEEQTVDIFYRISEFITPSKVAAELINPTKGMESYFSSGSEYKTCVPTLTSNTAPVGSYYSSDPNFWKALDGTNDTVVTIANNASSESTGFSYTFENAVVITSIAILGHNIDGVIGKATQNDQIVLTPSTGDFTVLNEQRGEEVTFTVDGKTYKEKWRVINVAPIVSNSIAFYVSASTASSNTTPKHIVQFVVRGYSYIAGKEITINSTANWSAGAWSNKNGWPTCVCQHGGRLMWGQDDSVQGTQIGNNNSFATSIPLEDSDGISTTLRDEGINAVNALVSMKSLLALTAGGVFASNSSVMTPSDAGMPKQSGAGGGAVRPVVIGTRVLYVLPKTGKIYDSAYDYSTDAFNGGDLCLVAEHLFDNEQIVEMAYQQEPYGLLWVLLASGKLLCLTYVAAENVCAWTQMQTVGKVESICTIPGQKRDELFLIVNRDGVLFVEKMADRLASKDPKEQFFVDCGRTYRGNSTAVISGLDYLNGKEVTILADGKVCPVQTVQDGQIVLPYAASVVHVGLAYTAKLRTLSGELNTESGSSMAKKKRYVGAMLCFVDSRNAKVGAKEDRLEDWLPKKPQSYDTAPELVTEDKRFTFTANYEQMPSIFVEQHDPLPLTVTAIIPITQVGNV